MPRQKKKELSLVCRENVDESEAEEMLTLTATRAKRTIKPNRKYLSSDSVQLSSSSKNSSRASTPAVPASDSEEEENSESEVDEERPSPKPRGRPRKKSSQTTLLNNLKKTILQKPQLVIPITDIRHKMAAKNTPIEILKKKLNLNVSRESAKRTTPLAAPKKLLKPVNVRKTPLKPKVDIETSDDEIEMVKHAAKVKRSVPIQRPSNEKKKMPPKKKVEKEDSDEDFSPDDSDYELDEPAPPKRRVVESKKAETTEESEEEEEAKPAKRQTRSSLVNVSDKEKESEQEKEKPKPKEERKSDILIKITKPANKTPPQASKIIIKPVEKKSPHTIEFAKKAEPIKKTLALTTTTTQQNSPSKATITIVNISDIIKMKENADKKKSPDEPSDEEKKKIARPKPQVKGGKIPATSPLVKSILDRKRTFPPQMVNDKNSAKKARLAPPKADENKKPVPLAKPKVATKSTPIIDLEEDDEEIDFEDVLTTNIVTSGSQKVITPSTIRSRRKLSEHSLPDENQIKNVNKVPSPKKIVTNNNNIFKSTNNNGKFSTAVNKPAIIRSSQYAGKQTPGVVSKPMKTSTPLPAPRILNSSLTNKSTPFSKFIEDYDEDNHFSIDLTDADNNLKLVSNSSTLSPTPIQNESNNNSVKSSPGVLRNSSNNTNKSNIVQNIPTKVGAPRMKKITCFETWYVINIPNNEIKLEKSTIDMSMITLGNQLSEIEMPSDRWSYKITLTKLKSPLSEDDEFYTGVVQDGSVAEEDKHMYEPLNIMFRRKKNHLQFDRCVVFKNRSFFINIDGRSCKLVGAPQTIETIDDIETLLYIVNDVSLRNGCVELSGVA